MKSAFMMDGPRGVQFTPGGAKGGDGGGGLLPT
jgi:hypothetical protein